MRIFSLFHRTTAPPAPSASPPSDMQKGLMRPLSAASLLAPPRRQKLLEHICRRTSLSRAQFASLYRAPLERYAELVQQFPASESHHHAYPGGMLDHGLEIVAYALKLRQSHLLPVGASPETQAAQAEAWTAATAYAALLHDIGKIAVDLHVEYADGACWHPWHGPLDHPYRFRYRKDRRYRLHEVAAGLLYTTILDRTILDWLCTFPELWSALLHVLAGHYEHAGVLGELVTQADQASVAQELGGNPQKALLAPKQALQRKLLDGLRHLVREELKLNQPQASDGWLTQDALWLVSKTVADKLRAHLLAQGVEGIPDSNPTVFDVLQEHAVVQPTSEGKAIWKAVVTSQIGWTHSFTLLRLSPALIWEATERPAPFAGVVTVDSDSVAPHAGTSVPTSAKTTTPASSSSAATVSPVDPAPITTQVPGDAVNALLDLLGSSPPNTPEPPDVPPMIDAIAADLPPPTQDSPNAMTLSHPGAASPAGPSGEHFIAWLRDGVATHRLVINDAKALVHTVAGTAYLVSPGIFRRYAQEHPEVARLAKQEQLSDWAWVQKRFERLGLHRKQDNGLNIWTCEVTGARKSRRLHGYFLSETTSVFANVPADNPYLRCDYK